jgi:DNA mismatch repair protein MutS2
METINIKIKQKLESYQELYDSNQKTIYVGQKIEDIANRYFNNKSKKDLIADFEKIENSKRKKKRLQRG